MNSYLLLSKTPWGRFMKENNYFMPLNPFKNHHLFHGRRRSQSMEYFSIKNCFVDNQAKFKGQFIGIHYLNVFPNFFFQERKTRVYCEWKVETKRKRCTLRLIHISVDMALAWSTQPLLFLFCNRTAHVLDLLLISSISSKSELYCKQELELKEVKIGSTGVESLKTERFFWLSNCFEEERTFFQLHQLTLRASQYLLSQN